MLPVHHYTLMHDDECRARIAAAKRTLGSDLIVLGHHYQRDEVYCHADYTGDSLKLSRYASQSQARYIVFCGVHFMAEVADIIGRSDQTVVLPDLAAGCQLADTATPAAVGRAWVELSRALGHDAEDTITPITYINSAADLKGFCGERGGAVCTSSNARLVMEWAWQQREKVLFFPDQHLGRNTAVRMGLDLADIAVWNFGQPRGGLTNEQIKRAKLILWSGFCSVHQMFRPEQMQALRQKNANIRLIAHPECSYEVCQSADVVGSTETILKTVRESPPGSTWAVATEFNMVQRLGREVADQGGKVEFLSPTLCMCSTMYRIDQQHLAWVLEGLVEGTIINRISVPDAVAVPARRALERMLALAPTQARQPRESAGADADIDTSPGHSLSARAG